MIIAIRDAKSLTIFVSSAPTALLTPPGETFTSLAAPAWTVSDGTNVQIGFTGMGMRLLRILGSDRSQAIPDCQRVLGGSLSASSLPITAVTFTANAVDTVEGIKSSVQLLSSNNAVAVNPDPGSVIAPGSIYAVGVNLPQTPAVVSFIRPSFSSYSGGALITILGSDFLDGPQGRVAFGKYLVPFKWVSSFEIHCVTPSQLPRG